MKEYNRIRTEYFKEGSTLTHVEVLTQLDNAETQVFQDLHQDRQFRQMGEELEKSGALRSGASAFGITKEDMSMMKDKERGAKTLLADAYSAWVGAQGVDVEYSDQVSAFLNLHQAAVADATGTIGYLAKEKRDFLTKEAHADQLRDRYQNTIRYYRDEKMQGDYHGEMTKLFNKHIEAGEEAGPEMLYKLMGEIELGLGAGLDSDVYGDILDKILTEHKESEKGAAAVSTAGVAEVPVEESIAEGDTEGALARARQRQTGLKDWSDEPELSATEIATGRGGGTSPKEQALNEANKAYKDADTPEAAKDAWEDAWRKRGYDPSTVPDHLLKSAPEFPFGGVADRLVSGKDDELKDWLVSRNGAALTRKEAAAFMVRNKEALKQAIVEGISKGLYGGMAGFYNSEWKSILGPVLVKDANRPIGGK